MKVKNWQQFQHYKDRNPTWIKLHKSLLDDYVFQCLPVASRALAPMIWLLASEHLDGEFDGNAERLAFRLRMTPKEVETAIKPLIEKGFIECASDLLADCYHDASPETEKRREETEKEKSRFAEFWVLYPRKEAKAKAESAWKSAKADAQFEVIAASLQTFKASEQWTKDGGKFIPHASTWLNQRRWEDEHTQVAEAPNVVPLQKQAWICECCGGTASRKTLNAYYCADYPGCGEQARAVG